jgi:hypothetical protein
MDFLCNNSYPCGFWLGVPLQSNKRIHFIDPVNRVWNTNQRMGQTPCIRNGIGCLEAGQPVTYAMVRICIPGLWTLFNGLCICSKEVNSLRRFCMKRKHYFAWLSIRHTVILTFYWFKWESPSLTIWYILQSHPYWLCTQIQYWTPRLYDKRADLKCIMYRGISHYYLHIAFISFRWFDMQDPVMNMTRL